MPLSDPLEKLMKFVEEKKDSSGVLTSRYFTSLKSGEMSRDVFESSQQQFFFAVRFFSRAMAALAARTVDSHERFALIHNLAEEHGLVDDDVGGDAGILSWGTTPKGLGFNQGRAHDQTFRLFLNRLSNRDPCSKLELAERPAVRAFNLALWAVCAIEPPPTAFACLGAIEFAFADISALIGQCVVHHQWISRDALVHYKLHAEIDKRHAGDFFSVVAASWNSNGEVRRQVESGLTLGLYLFRRLYDELLTEALANG